MKILIAEDEEVTRRTLEQLLDNLGYEVMTTVDGLEAWQTLQTPEPPGLVILDWLMPGLDGSEVCRRVRETPRLRGLYVILLTGQSGRKNILEGLRAGANDYITKPFDPEELEARLRVASQVVRLQSELADRVHELEESLAHIKLLQQLLPMCCYCKKVRDDENYWHQVEKYLEEHTSTRVTSAICPTCWKERIKPELKEMGIDVPDRLP